MIQSPDVNRQIVLTKRPSGEPTTATLRLALGPVPGPGQMLLRTEYLSLDP